jgi:hypothetical protein
MPHFDCQRESATYPLYASFIYERTRPPLPVRSKSVQSLDLCPLLAKPSGTDPLPLVLLPHREIEFRSLPFSFHLFFYLLIRPFNLIASTRFRF